MTLEHLTFIDSISFMPCSLSKLPETFGLTSAKSCYPYYFNTNENMNYVGEVTDVWFYGADAMSVEERTEFLALYEAQKSDVFDNRNVLEAYCQDDKSGSWYQIRLVVSNTARGIKSGSWYQIRLMVFKFVLWYSNSSRGIQIRLVVGKFVLVVFKFVCIVLWVIAVDFPCALL